MVKPIVYTPTVAKFLDDIETSYRFLENFRDRGYQTGLMLVVLGGKSGLEGQDKDKQYANFGEFTSRVGQLPVIVMASNRPLQDLDFYHRPGESVDHIKSAIDFARGLPGALDQVVTFHLNSLLTPDEWKEAGNTPEERFRYFRSQFEETVFPALRSVAKYASEKGVKVQVETCPVPEFGDCGDDDSENGIILNQLGNPYPLFSGRGIEDVRSQGLGVTLDLCHTFTLYNAANNGWFGDGAFDVYKGLFPIDLDFLRSRNIVDEVASLKEGDVVHLNDSKGLFVPGKSVHDEGIALGEGEMSTLEELVPKLFNSNLRVVFEVHENDFKNRPNLRKSIDYVLERI